MATVKKKKDERIDLRVSADQKAKIQKAVDARGVKLSEFILSLVMPEVEQILIEQERIVLNNKAWQSFIDLLEKPTSASSTLKAAMKDYRKVQGGYLFPVSSVESKKLLQLQSLPIKHLTVQMRQ